MKNKLALLLLLPLTVMSCAPKDTGFSGVKSLIDNIEVSSEHPFYKVVGALDFNNTLTTVNATFSNNPNGDVFVPYTRYNEGFYNKYAEVLEDGEDIKIYAMASHSYWLRAPLKIDKSNFYFLDEEGLENITTANYILTHIITSWVGGVGSSNPTSNYTYYELLPDGGFAVGGRSVHTVIMIDNYPCYPSGTDSEFGEWKPRNPLPAYKNKVDGKFDIRFEYDKNGWLKHETFSTINYDYGKTTVTQTAGESRYYYETETETW